MISSLLFYAFASVLLGSAIATVTVRQPVTAVLCMILCFFNAAALFLFLNAEFLAFILLIVYVGAVAVLFLFVVMMLNVKGESASKPLKKFLPIGLGLGGILFVQVLAAAITWPSKAEIAERALAEGNTESLGLILYTDYALLFQMAGLILLAAMIGAIILTHRDRKEAKKQYYQDQLDRQRDEVIEIRKVKAGEGVL